MLGRRRDNVPKPSRTLSALRNLGYNFNSAVADLVDNSIAAGATEIVIEFRRMRGQFYLNIADNGGGLLPDELYEAMRLGSESKYDVGSLGKFGFGLKTASISQCRRLTVASRAYGTPRACAFILDLDEIDRTDRWEIFEVPTKEIRSDPVLNPLLEQQTGTVVKWENLDRLCSEYAACRNTDAADNWFGRLLADLRLHLRMVFHRFMDGCVTESRLVICFNGDQLTPWDPFCRAEPNTIALATERWPTESESGLTVRVEPYVLPVRDGPKGFSSPQAWEEARGLLPWNDSQGYYIYRENRLIHCGGWLRTRAKDEHTKYARVGIFFNSELDDAFDISVNKTQLKLPRGLFEHLKGATNPLIIKAAQSPYREGTKQGKSTPGPTPPDPVGPTSAGACQGGESIVVPPPDPGESGGSEVVRPDAPEQETAASETVEGEQITFKAGTVYDGRLWRTEFGLDSLAVIINQNHPVYRKVYQSGQSSALAKEILESTISAVVHMKLHSANPDRLAVLDELRDSISEKLRADGDSLDSSTSTDATTGRRG